jgi:hypothetical protein
VFLRVKSGKSWYGKLEKLSKKRADNRIETEKQAILQGNPRLQGSKNYLTDGRNGKKPKPVEAEKLKKARTNRKLKSL